MVHASPVGRMAIAMKHELSMGQKRLEEGAGSELDGLGIGTAVLPLELVSSAALCGCHPAFASQRAVVEVVDEPALCPGCEVDVEGEELGVFEGFQAVHDGGFC